MALVPNLSSPVGASPPHQPTSAPTPGPTITHITATSLSPPPPPASVLTPNRPSQAKSPTSRVERWIDGSLDPECLDSPPRRAVSHCSYRDAVIATPDVQPAEAVPKVADAPSVRTSHAQRESAGGLSVRLCGASQDVQTSGEKDGAWKVVESKRTKQQRLKMKQQRLRPVDLAGRCFNCFS
jgi:hypothetical protein